VGESFDHLFFSHVVLVKALPTLQRCVPILVAHLALRTWVAVGVEGLLDAVGFVVVVTTATATASISMDVITTASIATTVATIALATGCQIHG
jgi:hypothetical protein